MEMIKCVRDLQASIRQGVMDNVVDVLIIIIIVIIMIILIVVVENIY